MDKDVIAKLAKGAEERALNYHVKYQELVDSDIIQAHAFLCDFFYWSGYMNAYKGIVAQMELQEELERGMDATSECP